MPDLARPDWDDEKRMPIWVNAMLDFELEAAMQAANAAPDLDAIFGASGPIGELVQQLKEGIATPAQQWRAAEFIEQTITSGRPGPKSKPKMDRNPTLAMPAQDARRIMALWRDHYRRADLSRAVGLACHRWIEQSHFSNDQDYNAAVADLSERVHQTLQKPNARNFGVP